MSELSGDVLHYTAFATDPAGGNPAGPSQSAHDRARPDHRAAGWRESAHVFHVRDPFPVGGVVEDPATGAAAAAFGAYLREIGEVAPAAALTLHQGEDMGRPGLLRGELRAGDPRIRVSGAAVPIPKSA
ncbi:PhzF family phenazine biosynthesis protein [Actinomadura sp. 21ATH]|uniref:PhzF family phenazine biosynthesis protein n=1 Tax=Actinomadura sp. 21ATH TaxID=1735444 RepID=UPI0035C0A890